MGFVGGAHGYLGYFKEVIMVCKEQHLRPFRQVDQHFERRGCGGIVKPDCSGLIATDTSMGGLSTRRGDIDETET